ncbi:MAG: HNH endonuclease signature motif containing protein, partial [Myxococcota bacterium]
SRRAPAAVAREVWARDEARCTYVAPDGRRCAETACLELDHVVPWAKGGASTAGNLRLRCRTHNQMAADQSFGRGFMDGRRTRGCREDVVRYAATLPAGQRALRRRRIGRSSGDEEPLVHCDALGDVVARR